MPITPYTDIDEILHTLRRQIQQALGEQLVGLYLYGSLVTGDFDHTISDIDLLAVTGDQIDGQTFDRLDRMHVEFVAGHPVWNDRIEIAYLAQPALETFRSQSSTIAIISPGEPFHLKEAGKDWLINWWVVRKYGVALAGPQPAEVIAPISQAEYLRAVREQVLAWGGYIVETRYSRPFQAYAILTLCRALYATTNGEQVSKRQAGLWAAEHFPQWSALIHNALAWRTAWREPADPDATFAETVSFVHFVIDYLDRT
ncbi:MAG TPA: aminoglycoside adenylyltransferase domain-containing protein [Herpetosiphonaceae bacterium]